MNNNKTINSIIKQLPPEISNKIAAGEVVQRPASVIKELLDNSIDSGADSIKIIIENAGRTLMQVIDNGCGMSNDDLALSFSKHATSKINSVDDLFSIRTLGFRGEALASIGSIAQVQVKTKRAEDENGWQLDVFGGKEKDIIPTATDNGTSIAIRNLFFNVPARRQFLKTDATELRHILRTVQYAALANTDVEFKVIADTDEIYNLPAQPLKDRISSIFGSNYKASLIAFEEKTSYLRIYGYVSDPKLAKKSRGEQFLFVNGRPFQHRYLTHVILSLYDAWTKNNEYPFYALYFEIDPTKIDVNVHPSKMEVKFEDERSIIQLAKSVVNKALNSHFHVPDITPDNETYLIDNFRNDFDTDFKPSQSFGAPKYGDKSFSIPSRINIDNVRNRGDQLAEKLYGTGGNFSKTEKNTLNLDDSVHAESKPSENSFWQLHNSYIITQTRTGVCLIDQHLAHKRIIYEKAKIAAEAALPSTQQLLFTQTISLSATDFALIKEVHAIMLRMGFSIQLMSGNTVLLSGVPADIEIGNEQEVIVEMLQQYHDLGQKLKLEAHDKLAISFASKAAIPRGKKLDEKEMEAIVDQLFACEQPYVDPLNKPTIIYLSLEEIQQRFR